MTFFFMQIFLRFLEKLNRSPCHSVADASCEKWDSIWILAMLLTLLTLGPSEGSWAKWERAWSWSNLCFCTVGMQQRWKIFMWQLECSGTNVPICKPGPSEVSVSSPSSEIRRKGTKLGLLPTKALLEVNGQTWILENFQRGLWYCSDKTFSGSCSQFFTQCSTNTVRLLFDC